VCVEQKRLLSLETQLPLLLLLLLVLCPLRAGQRGRRSYLCPPPHYNQHQQHLQQQQ
jgi:hypothetical protein